MTRRGRPEFEPTDEQRAEVYKYAKVGVPHDTIAKILEIGQKTLVKYFEKELEKGRAECTSKYINTLYTMANTERVPSAVYFYLKTREGWRETDKPAEQTTPVTMNFNSGPVRPSKLASQENNGKQENE